MHGGYFSSCSLLTSKGGPGRARTARTPTPSWAPGVPASSMHPPPGPSSHSIWTKAQPTLHFQTEKRACQCVCVCVLHSQMAWNTPIRLQRYVFSGLVLGTEHRGKGPLCMRTHVPQTHFLTAVLHYISALRSAVSECCFTNYAGDINK